MLFIFQLISITAAIAAFLYIASLDTFYYEKALRALFKRLGFGYIVYHSCSQKYFYSIRKKSAMEWMQAGLSDTILFSNASKEVLCIKFGK